MNSNLTEKKVITNSALYSISGLLQKCFSFFLLPLYTVYLSTEDYGVINIANNFAQTMVFVIAFSLYSAVLRYYVEYKDDNRTLKRFYGTVISFVMISSIAFCLIMTLFRNFFQTYVFGGMPFYPVILVCFISLIFNCQYLIYDNIMKSQQKGLKISIVSLSYFFINIALNIVFVVVCKMGALGTILANMIVYILFTIVFYIDIIRSKKITICLDISLLKASLKYSLPILPHNLSSHIALLFSSLLIGNVNTLGALGVYAVAAQLGSVSDTVQMYINNAYTPWLFEKLKTETPDGSIAKVGKLLGYVIGLLLICIALFSHDYIVLFVSKSYIEAWHYVPLICIVYTIKIAYYFYVSVLLYYKQAAKKLFIATVSSSLLNVLASSLLIPAYGVYGSILADAISMVLRVAIVLIISRKFNSVAFKLRDFLVQALIIIFFICAGYALTVFIYKNTFALVNLFFKIAIVIAYCAIAFLINRKQLGALRKNFLKKKEGCNNET